MKELSQFKIANLARGRTIEETLEFLELLSKALVVNWGVKI